MFNVGKLASKAVAKKAASVPAKKQNEMMVRGGTKYMGDVEEVKPLRLAGPEAKKPGMSKAAIAAGVAAGAGATALALRGKEDKAETAKPASRVATSAAAPSTRLRDMDIRDTAASKSEKPASFGAAFKAARAAGKDVFTYEGKRYTTETADAKKAAAPSKAMKMEERGVREGRNENIGEDTRKRAMESVANLAKGGAVMKKKPAMKKTMPFAKGGAVKKKKGC